MSVNRFSHSGTICQSRKINRKDLIFKKRKNRENKRLVGACFFTYNEKNPPLKKFFKDSRHILDLDPRTKKIADQVRFVSTQSKNLQKQLTSSKQKDLTQVKRPEIDKNAGCFKCGRCRVACPKIKEEKCFESTVTGRSYKIYVENSRINRGREY